MEATTSSYWDSKAADFKRKEPLGGIRQLLLKLNPQSILEVGCGCGDNLKLIKARYKVGLDYSPKMLERAHKSVPDALFLLGSVADIPFCDNSFDLVLSYGCLQHVPEDQIDKALQELFRVSKKHIIISEANISTSTCIKHDYAAKLNITLPEEQQKSKAHVIQFILGKKGNEINIR